MNEFGEWVKIYVWPEGHEEGESYGDDFYERLSRALKSENLQWETV